MRAVLVEADEVAQVSGVHGAKPIARASPAGRR